jgi:V8-like Glu-specific endopeptidase
MVEFRSIPDRSESMLDGKLIEERSGRLPYKAYGMVRISYKDKTSYYASGTIIGPKLVLTSASNILAKPIETVKEIVFFRPEFNFPIKVIDIHYPEEYKHVGKEDYAILVLECYSIQYIGDFKLKSFRPEDLIQYKANIYGYPSSIEGQFVINSYLWGTQVNISIDDSEDKLYYTLQESSGMTGSVLYIEEDSNYYPIGVHIGYHPNSQFTGIATFLNSARISKINEWAIKHFGTYQECSEPSLYPLPSTSHPTLEVSEGFRPSQIYLNLQKHSIQLKLLETMPFYMFTQLKILDLSFNNIGTEGAAYLAYAQMDQLTHLKLAFNNLGALGAEIIMKGNFISCIFLNLDGNNIGNSDIYSDSSLSLEGLSMMCNQLDDDNAYDISSSFRYIVYLNLSNNNIGDRGAAYISDNRSNYLKYLYLNNNCITSSYIMHSYRRQIIQLGLGGNDLGQIAYHRLTFVFKNMEILDLSDNNISTYDRENLKRYYGWRLII